MNEELIATITSEGLILNESVQRKKAHRKGIWHRAVSIFVLNPNGEILIERRSEHKDLFPGYYDIVGGHLQAGQSPIDAAVEEIHEELSLNVKSNRLHALCKNDDLIENIIIPEKNIINLERKTIYILKLNIKEEKQILKNAAEWVKLSQQQLEKKGVFGEVSHIEFWSWEKLYYSFTSRGENKLASGTISALVNREIREKVFERCIELRKNCRRKFAKEFPQLKRVEELNIEVDKWLFEVFNPKTLNKANISLMNEIFENGQKQYAGAYKMGDFRRHIQGDSFWAAKYRDPGNRYVENLLNAISFGQSKKVRDIIIGEELNVKNFVSKLLELPLTNGERFRDSFGNLIDIAVARNAVLFYLENNFKIITKTLLNYPTGEITQSCIEGGRLLYEKNIKHFSTDGYTRLLQLFQLGIEASSADFNNLNFQEKLNSLDPKANLATDLFNNIKKQELASGLGENCFLQEFYINYIEKSPRVKILFLPGSASQATISLTIAQDILEQNKNATINFIPKSGYPGNDLSYNDAIILLKSLSKKTLKNLTKYKNTKRFNIFNDGPLTHGLDPDGLNEAVAQAIVDSDIILAEGQAYAEIRGWKKPVYIAFRVNGRVAAAIHGHSLSGKCGFIRITPRIEHYQLIKSKNVIINNKLALVSQTTSEYVQAVLHENLDFIINDVFLGNRGKAIDQIQKEAQNLNKTFSQIILGTTSILPDKNDINKFKERHFPVFACGGGGGFSAVTIKALRQLGIPTVAGVPSTDDGGSTGILQKELLHSRGFVFGVGDMASILQESMDNEGKKAILSYRFPYEPASLVSGVKKRIVDELVSLASGLGAADDLLSFINDQLNLARIIDRKIQSEERSKLSLKGASIRNLNIIAAYELCNALGDSSRINEDDRTAALIILEKALGIPSTLIALPVTFEECRLYLDYTKKIPYKILNDNYVPTLAFDKENNRIYGQQFIDKLPHDGKRKMVGVTGPIRKPRANEEYLRRIREANLVIMGAGSLISSQLAQLVIPGVIDELIEAQDKRKILVLNHVKMDETREMTVKDHIRLIEEVAEEMCTKEIKKRIIKNDRNIQISDIFTDIVIPRTVARELEQEMVISNYSWKKPLTKKFNLNGWYKNKYIDFIEQYPEIRKKYQITDSEMEILSFLEQPSELYKYRTEKGRYRGAVFATKKDINYLIQQGIQQRNIYQVDSIGNNTKIIKKEGAIEIEYFPGLLPQALMGIFKIVLERGINNET